MNIHHQALAAALALAIVGVASPAHAAPLAGPADRSDAALVVSVRDAIDTKLGAEASELTITALGGKVTLHGWAKSPKQEEEARQIARKVPGVSKAYSRVHVWSSTDVE